MISIKLLEIRDKKVLALKESYPEFVKALNHVLEYNVEIIFEPEASFDGYYLIPTGGTAYLNEKYKNYITEKSFLLGAYNADIPNYIEKFKPAGLNNWMLFEKASPAVIGRTEIIKASIIEEDDMIELYEEYAEYSPYPADNTYETVDYNRCFYR